jgi:hypothetical protein
MAWTNAGGLPSISYTCGHCGNLVATGSGWPRSGNAERIYLCSHCDKPTYFNERGAPLPGVAFGGTVAHLPPDVELLYSEARRCTSAGAYTASVLLSRKLLMNIAVAQGAKAGESFISYVEFLANSGYVPPNGRGWVDHIRRKGNEATHEIVLMSDRDAQDLIAFSEMLLKFIYEFPSKVPGPPP